MAGTLSDSLAAAPDATRGWSRALGRRDRNATNYEPLVPAALALILGIISDRLWPVEATTSTWVAATSLAVWWLLWWLRRDRPAAVTLLVAIAALGGAWHHVRWQRFAENELAGYATETARAVLVEVVALEQSRIVPPAAYDPLRIRPRGERTRLLVRAERLRDGTLMRPVSGRAQLEIEGDVLDLLPGDRLAVWARLSRPATPGNPGQFDFAAHARADRRLNRLAVSSPASITRLARGSPWRPTRWIAAARRQGDELLRSYLPRHRASLASALLLGLREQVGDERTDALLRTGTIHVLSISGMHVGIVAASLFVLLRLGWLPERLALVLIATATCLYAWLADAQPPVVRAALLVTIVCMAAWLGRQALSFSALATAAIVVLVLNPADLFRIGPQLSFLCVAALVWFSPATKLRPPRDPLDLLIWQTRPWHIKLLRGAGRWAAELTLLSFWVWLVTLPLIAARFHLISPLAPLLNTVLWLPVTLLLLAGLLMLIAATVLPPLAVPLAKLCTLGVALLDTVVAWFARAPIDHYWVAGPREWAILPLYAVLAIWVLFPRWRPRRQWRWTLVVAWATIAWIAPAWLVETKASTQPAWNGKAPDALRCTFLSVGHGCAVVLETPDEQVWVYDVGQLGSPHGATDAVAQYLWRMRHRRIDVLCLSHADVDHFNGAPELIERFEVGRVVSTPTLLENYGPALVQLDVALRGRRLLPEPVTAGVVLHQASSFRVEVLSPPADGLSGNDNAHSLVLLVEYRGRKILLTGDLEGAGVERLLGSEPIDCDLILAPHHGSARSNPPGLANWATPEWVVISGGREPPAPELLEAYQEVGAQILHTANDGAVQFTVDAKGIRAATWRGRQAMNGD